MNIEFIRQSQLVGTTHAAIAVLVFKGRSLSADAQALDVASSRTVSRAIAAGRFNGEVDQQCELIACDGIDASRLLLLGAGDEAHFDALCAERVAARAYAALKLSGTTVLELRLSELTPEHAARAALGLRLAAYRFDRYLTKRTPDSIVSLEEVRILADDPEAAGRIDRSLGALAQGIAFARDLVSEPPNVLFPSAFAERVVALRKIGLEVTVLGEADMSSLGMGALLGVGQGSARESQLAIVQWHGASDPKAPPIAIVGKGVTFDTGGISIKDSKDMDEMKADMAGAATVAGLMMTLALRNAKVNAVGILGLVENMPDGNAQRPGDIVKSMSGQTIELIDTDAEGRLVLADALWYAQKFFHPAAIVDLATLTGAVVYALGDEYAALFSNDDGLAHALDEASRAEQEGLWRLPLPAQYDKWHDTQIADMKNVGGHPSAGSITAALFLQRFIRDTPWAHLDIAGVAWRKTSTCPTTPAGATGYGVRLLDRWIATNHEDR